MKKKEYMLLVLSMGMIMMLTGCGSEQKVEDPVVAIETEVETVENEVGYETIKVDMEYPAMLVNDTILTEAPDNDAEVVSVVTDEVVTVIGEVEFGGQLVDFYHVKTSDGVSGYIGGEYLNFNFDSLANVEEVEEPVEEVTETEEVTEVEKVSEEQETEAFEEYTRYTNTSVNIRSLPSKEGEVLGTYPINTEVKVVGVDDDWSQISYDGCVAFIKSSLLSESKTEVKQTTSSSSSGQSSSSSQSNSSGQSNNSGQSSSNQQQSGSGLNTSSGRGSVGVNTNSNPAGTGNGDVGDRDVIIH